MIVAEVRLQDYEIEFLRFVMRKIGQLDEVDRTTQEDILRKIEKARKDRERGFML